MPAEPVRVAAERPADAPVPSSLTKLTPGDAGYRRMILALFAAGTATFALLFSTQALLPALTGELHVSASTASWTVSATTLALALAVVPLSLVSERVGRRAMLSYGLTAAVALALVIPFAPGVDTLIVLRALQGVAIAGIPASGIAFIADEVEQKYVIGAIGLFVAGNSVGGMTGRILTGWVADAWGWRAALAAVAVLSVLCAALFRATLPRARHFTPGPAGTRAMLATVRGHLTDGLMVRLYAIGALFMTVFGSVYTVIGLRLAGEPFGLSQGLIGSVFVIYLVGTVSSAAAGRFVGLLGRRGTLYAAALTTAAGLLLTSSGTLYVVLLGLVLLTAGFFAGHAVASASVSRAATEGRAQATALYQVAYYAGSSVGATLGAIAFHAAAWDGVVVLGLVALVAIGGITLYATRKAVTERRTVAVAGR
ncbi:Inner membrane transport protein YnfM [Streptomyces sp. RB5]|uniref:Inner membrane transport protein YnfM n=1 Tax=Streptomyces smaragdinus TaxID=2585196 RepID=A0A7K0CRD2_9ACTN|nr:MFS transporter [Streptomyces smaragdinus]MQY15903.1 Inner membrane transport protein YnfM [Streptomyces smaragdinus]